MPSKTCFTPAHLGGKRGAPQVAAPYCCYGFQTFSHYRTPGTVTENYLGTYNLMTLLQVHFDKNGHKDGNRGTISAQHLRLPWKALHKSRDESCIST